MKRVKYLMMLLVMALAVSSCGYDDEEFLGTWTSYAYSEGYDEFELYDYERETYSFYRDGTGFYVYNNVRTQFYWDERSRGHLYLRHSDGLTEDFYYRFDHGDMLVSDTPGFITYRVFAYTGRY